MTLSLFRPLAREVRTRMTGHWFAALGILLLPAAVFVLYSYVAGYLSFLCNQRFIAVLLFIPVFLLVLHPMALGVLRWWAALAAGHDIGTATVLHFFTREHYVPTLLYTLQLMGRVLLRLLPYLLSVLTLTAALCFWRFPEATQLLLNNPSALTPYQSADLVISLLGVSIAIGPLAFFALLPLFFADYLYAVFPDLTLFPDAIDLYRCHRDSIFLLCLCYTGWLFLSLLVVPLLYTLPYLGMTYAVFCRQITCSVN